MTLKGNGGIIYKQFLLYLQKEGNMNNNIYVCKRMRLLSWLTERGFEAIRSQVDIYNPKYRVFLFEDSPELRKCVDDYYSQPYFADKA